MRIENLIVNNYRKVPRCGNIIEELFGCSLSYEEKMKKLIIIYIKIFVMNRNEAGLIYVTG